MNLELEPEVVTAIQNGQKIKAIKILRELRGIGLKESKQLVDSYCSQNNIDNPAVQKVSSGNGLLLLILFGVIVYFLYQYFS